MDGPVLKLSDIDNQPDRTLSPAKQPDAWDCIRALDDGENWTERTTVVSRTDHTLYTSWAGEIVTELVDSLPLLQTGQSAGMSDGGGEGEGEGGSQQEVAAEFQYMNEFTDQDFHSTDMDYLESVTSMAIQPSNLARQSLYVKFDPLVGSASPRRQVQPLSHAHSIPPHVGLRTGSDLLSFDTPPSKAGGHRLQGTPALPDGHVNFTSATISEKSVPAVPARMNATLLDSSPAPPDSSPALPDPDHTHVDTPFPHNSVTGTVAVHHHAPSTNDLINVLKFGDEDVQRIREEERSKMEERLAQLREEMGRRETESERQMEERLAQLREEMGRRETESERQVARARQQCEAVRCESLITAIDKGKLEEEVGRLRGIIAQREKTESELLDKYEELKVEAGQLEQDRDTALADFESLEKAFADLHQRYFKLKSSSQALQKNEEAFKQSIATLESQAAQLTEQYSALQKDTEDKLIEANLTYDSLKKEHSSEIAVSKVAMKKYAMQVESLEKTLKQKEAEKKDLTQICDELMRELSQQQH